MAPGQFSRLPSTPADTPMKCNLCGKLSTVGELKRGDCKTCYLPTLEEAMVGFSVDSVQVLGSAVRLTMSNGFEVVIPRVPESGFVIVHRSVH